MSVLLLKAGYHSSLFINSTTALTILEVTPEIIIIIIYLMLGLHTWIKQHPRVMEGEQVVAIQGKSTKERNSSSLSVRK